MFRRLDYSLRFTPDAAALYGTIADDHPLPVGRTYDIHVHAHALEAWGVRGFFRSKPLPGLRTEVGLSLLRGLSMLEGSIQGQGTALAPKQYEYDLWADDAYTRDPLFDRKVGSSEGMGASLDASMAWDFHTNWHVEAKVRDLPGFVQWRHLPVTQASALSQRTQTDGQDFQHWAPLVSGLESYAPSYRQQLPTSGSGELDYIGQVWVAAFGTTYAFGDWSPRVGMGPHGDGWQLVGWLWPTKHALGVDVQWGRWRVGLSTDGFEPGRAHIMQLNIAYRPSEHL
jgi:hypothetical protein